ncbi:hypothetical protein BH09BAC1_BH09BAC1_27790 [soil metagenome]
MHLITINRQEFHENETIGRISINGRPNGYTVEDKVRIPKGATLEQIQRLKIHGRTAIPYGEYKLGLRHSPKFSQRFYWSDSHKKLIKASELEKHKSWTNDWRQHEAIWILDVPAYQFILIHPGNTHEDTDGCLCVGSKPGIVKGKPGVLFSVDFYLSFYQIVYPLIKLGNQTISIL